MWITSHGAPVFRLRVLSVVGLTVTGAALVSPVRMGVTQGSSMAPTLRPGQPFLFRRMASDRRPVRRGDVLVFRSGAGYCVKRVLARGGEHFWAVGRRGGDELSACRLLAVDRPVSPWRKRWPRFGARKISVPPGHLFVIGDSTLSCDSRHYGPIPVGRVVGRVILPGDSGEAELARTAWTEPPPAPGAPRS